MHSTVLTSMWSPSSSAGGRVCGVIVSSPPRGPIVNASRTTIQPVGVFQLVVEHVGPRLVAAVGGMGDAEGAEPEEPRLSVEQATEDARCVEGRDTEPFDRAVGRHEGARVAVGEERVIGDRRKRRGRGRALRRGLGGGLIARHVVIQGPCQRPWPATSSSAAAGPQVPGSYGWTGGGASSSGCMIRHVSSTPSCRVKRVL